MLLDGQRLQGDLPNHYRLHPQAEKAPAAQVTSTATTAVAKDVPWYSWGNVEANIGFWAPLVFMGLICIVLWRTMKLMPRTKPQQIKPDSESAIGWADVAGADEAKAELQEVVEFLREPERFAQARRQGPRRASCCTARPAPARRCSPRRSRRSRARSSSRSRPPRSSRCSPASARPASGACSPRRARRRRPSCSSTRSTPSVASAARTTTPSASRRSTSCSSRWTASARPATSS